MHYAKRSRHIDSLADDQSPRRDFLPHELDVNIMYTYTVEPEWATRLAWNFSYIPLWADETSHPTPASGLVKRDQVRFCGAHLVKPHVLGHKSG